MEENKNPFSYANRFPNVIDTDDVTFELGKMVLDRINKEKLLNSIVKKQQEDSNELLQLRMDVSELQNKVAPLQKSNDSYQKTNKELDLELVRLRNLLSDKDKDKKEIKPKSQSRPKSNKKKELDGGEW